MSTGDSGSMQGRTLESAHVCSKCAYVLALAMLDLSAVTTGVVECPKCEWAGRIEIKVVNVASLDSI